MAEGYSCLTPLFYLRVKMYEKYKLLIAIHSFFFKFLSSFSTSDQFRYSSSWNGSTLEWQYGRINRTLALNLNRLRRYLALLLIGCISFTQFSNRWNEFNTLLISLYHTHIYDVTMSMICGG